MSHLILVDGNALGFAGMSGPRLTAGFKDTQSTFTVLKKVRNIVKDNPEALVMMLYDGRSWRKDVFKEYKANREQTEKQVEERTEYYEQKADTLKALEMLGVCISSANNMEADDLAYLYARAWKGDKVTVMAADKDWLQLVDERTTWVDPINDRVCDQARFKEFTGYDNVQQFVEAKAVLGDAGDNIKGIMGIGPKKLEQIYSVYSDMEVFLCKPVDECEAKWLSFFGKKLPKVLRELDRRAALKTLDTNKMLMDLSTEHRPKPKNLVRIKKPMNVEAFQDFCYENAFLSITTKMDTFIEPFKNNKYIEG